MTVSLPSQASRWTRAGTEPAVAVAARDALGTDARVAVWPPDRLTVALDAVDRELSRLDQQASRFRGDSEICRIHAAPRRVHTVSRGLAEAIGVALAAARWTGGRTDPTVGAALAALGYDRDFASVGAASVGTAPAARPPAPGPVPGWRQVRLRGRLLRLPAATRLDLGATGKGLGADRAAAAAWRASGRGGVLVGLGGDIAVAGQPPDGGWPVAIADSSCPAGRRQTRSSGWPPGRSRRRRSPAASGGAAGSSCTTSWTRGPGIQRRDPGGRCRWPRRGALLPTPPPPPRSWPGRTRRAWLAGTGLPARLAGHDGGVLLLGGWPGGHGGTLPEVRRG